MSVQNKATTTTTISYLKIGRFIWNLEYKNINFITSTYINLTRIIIYISSQKTKTLN